MDHRDMRDIMDHLSDEIMVFDAHYRMVYVNEACRRHYGLPPEALIGKTFDELDGTFWGNSTLPEVYATKKRVAHRQITNQGCDIITISVPLLDENGDIRYVIQNVNDLQEVNRVSEAEKRPVQITAEKGRTPYPGVNRKMNQLLLTLQTIRDTDVSCLFLGETGTGKSFLAQYLHDISRRQQRPFVTVNCACMPRELMESELFGYVKGAFSGAVGTKPGLVEAADGGTLFLDEISELPYEMQAKLLYFLQEKEFLPVGGTRKKTVDVRILAATNRDLRQMVANGTFREDLYFRLNTVELTVPPLRERREDIRGLAQSRLRSFDETYGRHHTLTEEALRLMERYVWPGNLRELSHCVEKAVVLTPDGDILPRDLPKSLFDISETPPPESAPGQPLDEALEALERRLITEAYAKYKTSVRVAKELGISQPRAYRLYRKYLAPPASPTE